MENLHQHTDSAGNLDEGGSVLLDFDSSIKRKMASRSLFVAACCVLIVCLAFVVHEWASPAERDLFRALLVAAGASISSLIVAAVLAHRLLRDPSWRIGQLVETTRIVCAGRDYSTRVPQRAAPRRRDEIDLLNEGINEMISRLQSRASEVGQVHEKLEQALLEKTENMRTIRDAALEESQLKSEILSNVSHEIRTPMTGVMGMIDLVLDSDLSEKQKDLLETAKTSSEAVIAVTSDLLDFTAMETGRMSFEVVDFNLRHHLSKIEGALDFQAIQKEQHFVCRIGNDVPFLLTGDPVRLQQVIFNLVGNAIKFSDHGQIVLTVEKESQTTDRVLLHCAVADRGIGIPKDKQKQIFKAFTQVTDASRRRYEGIGLGLAISCRIVEQMGGKIWVESEEGKGSVFHFTVDLALQSQTQRSPHTADRDAAGP